MTRRRSRYREIKSEINIVPLLDVLLVLVLIFMVTAPIITQNIKVDLPDATDTKTVGNNDNQLVIVEISGIGQYSLVVDHQRQEQLPSEQVISEVRARVTINPNTIFLIGGAKDVPYDKIIQAVDLLHQAGVKSVGLMIHPI